MRNVLTINTSSRDCKTLVRLLQGLCTNAWYADNEIKANDIIDNNILSLIIVITVESKLPQDCLKIHIPSRIPVLIMHPLGEALDITQTPKIATFVDIFQPPLSESSLQQKIELLELIGKQSLDLETARNENSLLQTRIEDLHESVKGHTTFLDIMSQRDGLTGLYNRRHFSTLIKEEFSRANEKGEDTSLLILNIDYFNEINKSCGQDYGDFVLNEFSARLTNNTRTEDFCFRYSGEDFAILMPSTNIEKALEKAEELRQLCEEKFFNNGYHARNVTVSIGLAGLNKHAPTSHEELIGMAEQALFVAKAEGRNRCSIYTPIDRSHFGTSEQNFKNLQETVSRVLDKTKSSTIRSLQLLAQGIMEGKNDSQTQQAKDFANLLCQYLHLPPTIIDTFKNSIVLHSSIRHLLHNEILNKKGSLSAKEWEIMSDFPYKLVELIKLFDYFSSERAILLHHSECYDGTGYPESLKGDEIPLGARVFSLITAFSAMNSDRPHRQKLPPEKILSELTIQAGKQFDPMLVLKLIDIIEKKGIFNIEKQALDEIRQTILSHNPLLINHVEI